MKQDFVSDLTGGTGRVTVRAIAAETVVGLVVTAPARTRQRGRQIDGDVATLEPGPQGPLVEEVRDGDLGAARPGDRGSLRPTNECAHTMPAHDQAWNEVARIHAVAAEYRD